MLKIYKASAGSGKTYTLTGEYLRILFAKYMEGNRHPYRNILAVTFTNKATDEMKQRILQELRQLSEDPEKSGYCSELSAICGSGNLRRIAQKVLYAMLNDYSSFNISTIDKFFQKTLRAFAREIGQYTSYAVELDQNGVLVSAIDTMMDSLEENPELLAWLITMSEDAVEKGENWNVEAQVLNLGTQIFSEEFKIRSRGMENILRDRETIEGYRRQMTGIIREFEDKARDLAVSGLDMISAAGLTVEDFPNGSKSGFTYLRKLSKLRQTRKGEYDLPGSRFLNAVDDVSKWTTRSAAPALKGQMQDLYDNGLNDIIREIARMMDPESEQFRNCMTAHAINRDLFVMGLLHDISQEITKYCRENNVVLISETTGFLNKIIDGSDTPFVYERIGVRLENYMLDEFQDTSKMQWDNFRPLLADSLASGQENLIVGDVKQSIYRWRNSDWKLLNSGIKETFAGESDEKNLEVNWRSREAIVRFNNAFFTDAGIQVQNIYNSQTGREDQSISSIYSEEGVVQQLPPKQDSAGLVSLNLVKGCSQKEKFRETVLETLPALVRSIHDRGIDYKDIALLVHRNAEGADLARYLIAEGFNVISEDSLYISSSPAVAKVIFQLRTLSGQADDKINQYIFGDAGFVPQEKTLYNICEEAIRALPEEEKRDVVFIQAFLDLVCDYVALNSSDIGGFVKWWDDYGVRQSVSIPEGENALRVMSIHKSKGLGFKAVIIPFFEAELNNERKEKILWCSPEVQPFDQFSLVPVRYGRHLAGTIFREDYLDEVKYSFIDALNATYVAFTRAKDELHVYMRDNIKDPENADVKSMADLLCLRYAGIGDKIGEESGLHAGMKEPAVREAAEEDDDAAEILTYTIGQAAEQPAAAVHTEEIRQCQSQIYSEPTGSRLCLSLKGTELLSEDNRSYGVLMHNILAAVGTAADLEKAVDESIAQGAIGKERRGYILDSLRTKIGSVSDRGWYDSGHSFLNEVAIIDEKGQRHVPDRVIFTPDKVEVIDYKFGNIHNPAYIRQVRSYMELIRQMGYENVLGYLWYFEEGEIEEC